MKAWGDEIWLVNNELYCLKRLIVLPGWQCSLHRHHVKDESFVVEQGRLLLRVGDDPARVVCAGDKAVRIPPGTWHRFGAFADRAIFVEVSTHHDDNDVERREQSCRLRREDFEGAFVPR